MHRDDSADQNSRHTTDSSIVLPRQKEITSRTEHISQTRCKAKQIEKEKKKVRRRGRKKEKKRKRKKTQEYIKPPADRNPKASILAEGEKQPGMKRKRMDPDALNRRHTSHARSNSSTSILRLVTVNRQKPFPMHFIRWNMSEETDAFHMLHGCRSPVRNSVG